MTGSGGNIVWFRDDLRIADNPALAAAIKAGGPTTAFYIHATDEGLRPIGGAARWWLHQSLNDLSVSLTRLGITLEVLTGDTEKVLTGRIRHHQASSIFWNRRYGRPERDLDATVARALGKAGVDASDFTASVLVEPTDIVNGSGNPYAVFTPFWNALRQKPIPSPVRAPRQVGEAGRQRPVDDHYRAPGWAEKLVPHWTIGEAAAARALHAFLDQRLDHYPGGRDVPGTDATSKLSPHLRFGEISPRQVWHAALAHAEHHGKGDATDKFLSELAWREFSYHLLYHRPDISKIPMQKAFAGIEWRHDEAALHAWQRGQTGIPIVDAGMRQLWQTGWMHNRVRMLTASFLAKNLLLDWRVGETWFWDTLVDADPANNPASWQWVAGCGADAAPYFRVFNPVTQSSKFDSHGAYVRHWLPELQQLPDKWVGQPFAAPEPIRKAAGVRLGDTYPEPIADLGSSRRRALAAFNAARAR